MPLHSLTRALPSARTVVISALLTCSAALPALGAVVNATAVASFTGANGATPYSALIQTADGALYGSTAFGGSGFVGPNTGSGTLFRIANGGLTNLLLFDGTNGANPYGALLQASDGNFYGTAAHGGASGCGVIYRLTTNNVFSVLVSFGGTNGSMPYCALIQGADGNLYGTTPYGGSGFFNGLPQTGNGTVFKVTPNGTLSILHQFNGPDGMRPLSGLTLGSDGNLYGTTIIGGTNGGWGTVFVLGTNSGPFASLVSFNGTNGANPWGGVVQHTNGALYGTTTYGGTGFNGGTSTGGGTIFQLNTNGVFQLLYAFLGAEDGSNPSWAKLALGKDGNLYGTTFNGNGTAFQVTPTGVFNLLLAFDPDGDYGLSPYGGLLPASFNRFYGSASRAGIGTYGAVFTLDPSHPNLRAGTYSGGTFSLNWSALLGAAYQVQFRTNSAQTNWSNLGGAVIATNSTITVTDFAASAPARFYRVILPLAP